jgi:hypothetical protein
VAITTLIESAASGPLTKADIERVCEEEKKSLFEFYDAFARIVAEKFAGGEYAWAFCDAAMNSLFTYAHPVSLSGLPAFAFEVYSAFDEGEYHEEGEALSRKLVAEALKKNA